MIQLEKNFFRNIAKLILPVKVYGVFRVFRAIICLFFSKNSYLRQTGYVSSALSGTLIDLHNNPVPMMNYQAQMMLKEYLKPHMKVLEFGSGYSTLFLSKYVRSVTSIEFNPKWATFIKSKAPKNCDVHLVEESINVYTQYPISLNQTFDLIIIDGIHRNDCVPIAISLLNDEGLILFDDTEHPKYKPGRELLAKSGFDELYLTGMKPLSFTQESTSIFFKKYPFTGLFNFPQ